MTGSVRISVLANPYTFTGRRLDPETGLYYYRNRYYHAQLGPFVSRDPIGYEGGWNLYGYVGSMPTRFGDPGGLGWFDFLFGNLGEEAGNARDVKDAQIVSLTNDARLQITQSQVAGDLGNNAIQAGTIVSTEAGLMFIPFDEVVRGGRAVARGGRGLSYRIWSWFRRAPRTTGRIGYGASDLSHIAMEARRQTRTFTLRNTAVLSIVLLMDHFVQDMQHTFFELLAGTKC